MQVIASVQILRGVAALLVVLLHLTAHVSSFSGSDGWSRMAKWVWSFSNSGVDLFFVISGVIMFKIAEGNYAIPGRKSLGIQGRDAVDFLLRRIFRIFPLFWVVLLTATILTLNQNTSWPSVADALLVVPSERLPVDWTLVYEIRFYLIVATIFLLPHRHRLPALCGWAFIEIAYIALGKGFRIIETFSATDPIMVEFAMGICVAILLRRTNSLLASQTALGVALGWFIGASVIVWYSPHYPEMALDWRIVLYGVPSAFLTYAAISLGRVRDFSGPRLLSFVGDCSYSLYLWHLPVILAVIAIWKQHSTWSTELLVPVCVLLICTISVGSYYLLERPAIKVGRLIARRVILVGTVDAFASPSK